MSVTETAIRAQRRTTIEPAPSPSAPVPKEQVERVCDTIWEMWRNRQLSDAQYVTAQRYQLDFETLGTRMRGAFDPERIGGTAPHYQTAQRNVLDAAHRLAEVGVTLSSLQESPGASVVGDTIVGVGWTLRQAGTHLWPSLDQDEAARRAGQTLRAGLNAIEEVWS